MQAYSGGWAEGLERGEAAITNTATNMLELQQRAKQEQALSSYRNRELAIQEENSAAQRKELGVRTALGNIQLNEAQKKEQQLNRIVDLNALPGISTLPPEIRQSMIQFTHSAGLTDEQGRGSVRNLMLAQQMVESDQNLYKGLMSPIVDYKKQAFADAEKQLQDAMAKGDQKRIPQLQAAVNNARSAYLSSLDGYGKHLMKLEEIQAQAETKTPNAYKDWREAWISEHPQGTQAQMASDYQKYQEQLAAMKAHGSETGRLGADFNALDSLGIKYDQKTGVINTKTVPTQLLTTAKGVANYSIALPSSFALSRPYWQAVLAVAQQINPQFSQMEYQARYALRKDFTSGMAARNIRSINTAIAHLDTFLNQAKALGNRDFRLWNSAANRGQSQFGNPRLNNFNVAATAIQNELATVFKGSGATDQEIMAWRKSFMDANSPEQMMGVARTAWELMQGRANALKDQYQSVMGQQPKFSILSPTSKSILERRGLIGGNEKSGSTSRTIIRTGTAENGRKVVQYSDGRIEYAN